MKSMKVISLSVLLFLLLPAICLAEPDWVKEVIKSAGDWSVSKEASHIVLHHKENIFFSSSAEINGFSVISFGDFRVSSIFVLSS